MKHEEIDRAAAAKALKRAQIAQTRFWKALSDLESELGIDDIDSAQDFEGKTIDDLLDQSKPIYLPYPKAGAQ